MKKNTKVKFIIVSPHGRRGGTIALSLLCKNLQMLGHNCKIFYPEACCMPGDSFWTFWVKSIYHHIMSFFRREKYDVTPVSGCKMCHIPIVGKNTIVVYPERFCGNILLAQNVVRWLLNIPPDEVIRTWKKNDLIFAYREIFNVPSINPEGRILHLLSYDRSIFKQNNYGDRCGKCYILRKGSDRKDLPQSFDGPIIDEWSFEKQVEALNKYKYCYIYDTQTGYGIIAALCGCIPIVIMEPGKQKSDYIKDDDVAYGVAYGESAQEIEYAVKTRGKLHQYLDYIEVQNKKETCLFLKKCKNYFFNADI